MRAHPDENSQASDVQLPASLLIISVFVVASCGLAYELITAAMASYVMGDSVFQFSSIIGCYLFAMGVGSWLSRYVPDRRLLKTFIEIEILVGLTGGLSTLLLFMAFAGGYSFRPVLYALVFVTGSMVGTEIPLIMRLLNRQQTRFADLVSGVLTFDYLGALVVSLLFPLLLAPHLGLARTALLFGMCNIAIALWAVFQLPGPQTVTDRRRALLVLVILLGAFIVSQRLIQWSEKRIYGDDIVYSTTTPYQRLVLTRWKHDLRLYINGNLQFSSQDEYRYHEALVHPALATLPQARNVLVLGGGDGLAVRELLKYPQLRRITLVDLDPAMTRLFRQQPLLTYLNQGSLLDARVKVVNSDAIRWLEAHPASQPANRFDAIIIDFPDPSSFSLGKLYSVPVYRLVRQHLADNGLVVVQSTSPFYARRSFWCINRTLQEAGFQTAPYHVLVPSFGEWGYVIGSAGQPYVLPPRYAVPLRFLNTSQTRAMFDFPADMASLPVLANHLNTQQLVQYFEQDWAGVLRH